MIDVAYTNIQSRTKINGQLLILLPLYKTFARGVHSHTVIYYCEVVTIFINVDTRIKGVETGDHETKQPFFLRDITWITRMQVILKL